MGFWLVQDAWGQGNATEAGLALLNSYFSQPDAVTIGSSHFDENARSGRVLSKLGFSYLANGTHSVTPQSTGEKVACLGMVLTPEQWHASHPFEIKTPRLTLSYFRQSDVEELSRIGGDAQVAPMILSATAPWPKTAVAQWIEKSRFRGKLGFRMSVRLGGAVIGVVGVSPVNPETPPSVMYFVDPNHWGHGYATEAMQHFLSVLIARFDLDAVIADHFDDNPTSGRVLRKLGFQETGKATGKSAARLEPAPLTVYRLNAQDLKA